MQSLLFLFASTLIIEFVVGQTKCVYTDPSTGAKLDLRALENVLLTFQDREPSDTHLYSYTPCRNAAGSCPNSKGQDGHNTGMVIQTEPNDPSICTIIADWDVNVQPIFDPSNSNGTWTFKYRNGDDSGCGTPRAFNAIYLCDTQVGDYMVVTAGEVVSCEYVFEIQSKWACPTAPADCKWSANNGNNVLDLSEFNNGTIAAESDSNENLFYRYSPCRNAMKCNTTTDMVDIFNIATNECEQNLALWQDTTVPTVNYNSLDKSWQFIYMNGENCNGFQSVTTIIWKCNPSTKSYEVIKANTIAPCQNLLEIESHVACG